LFVIDIFTRQTGIKHISPPGLESIDFVRCSVSGLARDGIYEGVTRRLRKND
jgi:hypothetical protein